MHNSPTRNVGQYYKSGDWGDYWRTGISKVEPQKILIRGYPIEEIISRLSFAEVVFLTLKGEIPSVSQSRVLDALLCCVIDHQFISSPAIATRSIASVFTASIIPSVAGGLLANGTFSVSPQGAALLINEAYAQMAAETLAIDEVANRFAHDYFNGKKIIPGFGHPTHKLYDPRAVALKKVALENGIWGVKGEIYEAIHREYVNISGRQIPINVDGIMACVLDELGFDPMEMPAIVAISLMPGLIAHAVEEIKDGVPLRVVPDDLGSKYIGPSERHLG